jgi:hypothetical protein
MDRVVHFDSVSIRAMKRVVMKGSFFYFGLGLGLCFPAALGFALAVVSLGSCISLF